MEKEPDYKVLYELTLLDLQNTKKQLEHWELKGRLLRILSDQLETFVYEVALKAEILKSTCSDLKNEGTDIFDKQLHEIQTNP